MAKKTIRGEDGKEYQIQENKPFYKKLWFKILVAIIVLVALVQMFGGGKESSKTKDDASVSTVNNTETETETIADYTIENLEIEEDDYTFGVSGILKNNTDKEKSYVQIEIPVYDAEGNKLGDALDNISNLEPGGTWKFKALFLGTKEDGMKADIEKYKVSGF